MTDQQLRAAVDSAIDAIDLELPIRVQHTRDIRDQLRKHVPEGTVLEVYVDAGAVLVVRAQLPGTRELRTLHVNV